MLTPEKKATVLEKIAKKVTKYTSKPDYTENSANKQNMPVGEARKGLSRDIGRTARQLPKSIDKMKKDIPEMGRFALKKGKDAVGSATDAVSKTIPKGVKNFGKTYLKDWKDVTNR